MSDNALSAKDVRPHEQLVVEYLQGEHSPDEIIFQQEDNAKSGCCWQRGEKKNIEATTDRDLDPADPSVSSI